MWFFCCVPFFSKPSLTPFTPVSPSLAITEKPEKVVANIANICDVVSAAPEEPVEYEVLCVVPTELLNISNPLVKKEFKKFCIENNLCMRCSYLNPTKAVSLIPTGLVFECPYCDSDEELSPPA